MAVWPIYKVIKFIIYRRKVNKYKFYGAKSGINTVAHRWLQGITRIIAGSISAIGNILIFAIRNPVAIIKIPPQALKSAIISGVVRGKIVLAHRNKIRKMINCGMAIIVVT